MFNMTEQNDFFKQMMDYQMTMMNNSFNALTMLQSRNEKAMDLFVNQMNWATEKWKGATVDMSKSYQDGFEKFKKVMEDNLAKAQSFTDK